MDWQTFKTEVNAYLGVNGTRRGIEGYRAAFTRAAMADLKFYVPELQDDVSAYEDGDTVPFSKIDAETIAEYVNARIARYIDKDAQLAASHMFDYKTLRRRTYIQWRDYSSDELPALELLVARFHALIHETLPTLLN